MVEEKEHKIIGDLELLECFNNISKLLEFICDHALIPKEFKAIIIGYLWNNRALCYKVDRKVREIWKK